MKKIITVLFAAVFALALAGCGEDKESSDGSKGDKASSVSSESSAKDKTSSAPTSSTSDAGSKDEGGTSAEGDSSEAESKPGKPQTIESRKYKLRPEDEDDNSEEYIVVEILDNGGWYLSSDTWAGQTYASYSFEEEAAGAYVSVIGYGAGSGEPNYIGDAKFTMTDEILTVQYDDMDVAIIYDRLS